VAVASTNAATSKKRNGGKMRHSVTFPLHGLTTNVGDRLTRAVQQRPLLALSGGVALGFVLGASVARRDGRLFVGAARIVLGWVASNLDAD
jgi:hypothetical protein